MSISKSIIRMALIAAMASMLAVFPGAMLAGQAFAEDVMQGGVLKDSEITYGEELPDPETVWPTEELYNMVLGEQDQIQAGTHPLPARIDKIEYKSDDDNVAEVDENGVITAVGTGSTQVHITLTTYTEKDPSGMILLETYVNVNVFEDKDTPILNIIQQPDDAEVNYPDGAEFRIRVDHPENVKSYQWEARVYSIEDSYSFNTFVLDGESAKTNRLILPSTEYKTHPYYFRCIVTDLNGKKHVSDEALMTVVNRLEVKPVLYVGEYAVEPGEILDLADYGIGSGTAEYDKNGLDVTLTELDFDNQYSVFDSTQASAAGLFLYAIDESRPIEERLEYNMKFIGDCRINNRYYDPDNNAGGVTINAYFGTKDEQDKPTVRLEGNGVLTVIGGSNSIYVHDGNLDVDIDVRTLSKGINYNSALYAQSIAVERGTELDINSCGPAITAEAGDIWIYDDAEIYIDSIAPHISKGLAAFALISSAGSINCNNAEIIMKCTAMPENIIPYNSSISMIAGMTASGTITLNDSFVDISLSNKHWAERLAHNYYGISGGDFTGLVLSGTSLLNMEIGGVEVHGAYGITVGGNIVVEPQSMIKGWILSADKAAGITTDSRLSVKDAIIDMSVFSASRDEKVTALTTGILCGQAELDVSDDDGYISCVTSDGAAFVAGGQEITTEPIGYTKGYKPLYTTVSKKTHLSLPEKSAISGYGYVSSGKIYKAETVYDLSDTSKPAFEVAFGNLSEKKENTIKASGRKVTIKYSKLKKKAQTIKRSKAIKVSGARGKITYKKVSVNKKKYAKKFSVNKKTGRITVKKGVKKGKYKLAINVTAAGNSEYKPKTVKVKTTIKVK